MMCVHIALQVDSSCITIIEYEREKSMGWKGLERNKLDYILTDILPLELSELFSFAAFYDFLLCKEQQEVLNRLIHDLKINKVIKKEILFKGKWGAKPLKYKILKGTNTFREMSVIQPFSALNIFLFMECYQKDILNFFDKNHCYSIRYHKKTSDLYYKTKNRNLIHYFQKQSKFLKKAVIQQTCVYFKITPFESINAFTDSKIWRMCNFKYKYYAIMDYKSCFDSIYTHSYKWIVERNVVDSKDVDSSHFLIVIDRIMQNINGLSSNGLVVGPEFSRMIAEILLQQIDSEIKLALSIDGIEYSEKYVVFRYVDDIYIYAQEQEIIDKIIMKYNIIGEKYLLRLNELKLKKGETPCLPKYWLEKTRGLSDTISNFFYSKGIVEYQKLPDEKRFLTNSDFFSIDRLKDDITTLMKNNLEDERTIVSFLLSTLLNNISKKKDGYILFEKDKYGKAMLLLDLAFFIYAFFPSFDQTRKLLSMIVYVNEEINFKNNNTAKQKLNKLINLYSFIFVKGNIFDLCDWFPFFEQYDIQLDMKTENYLISEIFELHDPIILGNMLIYSKYNTILFNELKIRIENTIDEEISNLSNNDLILQNEFWYIIVFHNCPYISDSLKVKMVTIINSMQVSSHNCLSDTVKSLVCAFIQSTNKKEISFFNWKCNLNYAEQITFRTYQRTLFKKYGKNKYGLYASIE